MCGAEKRFVVVETGVENVVNHRDFSGCWLCSADCSRHVIKQLAAGRSVPFAWLLRVVFVGVVVYHVVVNQSHLCVVFVSVGRAWFGGGVS